MSQFGIPASPQAAPIVVGLGELLWDEFPDGRRPGGAPANVAFQANQLGLRGVVCSRIGRDEPGDALLEFLSDHGLETMHIQRDADRPTGRVTVETDQTGSPRYVIHEHVAWDAIDCDRRTEELMAAAAAVCFGSLAQRSPTSRESIHRALAATRPDCLRVFDVN
ncbi:MAG: PfkB family carbohydrate kinase, partial [Planctomycetaceae bacterium]